MYFCTSASLTIVLVLKKSHTRAPVLANIDHFDWIWKANSRRPNTAGTIKFYRRYVDDTLVLIKPCDIPSVLKKFNSFDKNLNFSVDKFENGKVHFLDLEISESGIDVFRNTHTRDNFQSFQPWSHKTAWIKSLFYRAVRICSNTFFLNRQISTISKLWHGTVFQLISGVLDSEN